MKRRNGFTLIELLAVIIILAVIALIATPIVLNVVDSAKKSAAESSAKGFADAARLHYIENEFKQTSDPTNYTKLTTAQVSAITVQGEAPKTCTSVTYGSNGEVGFTGCQWGGYTFNCSNGNVTISE